MRTSASRHNPQEQGRLRAAVALLALLLIAVGAVLLAGWVPGDMATGPRIGIGMLAVMAGALMVALPGVNALLRRRARPGDYLGRCPVGESCAGCGAFNLKPRQACRVCSAPVNAS